MASPSSSTDVGSQINGNRPDNKQGHARKPSFDSSDHDGEVDEEDYHHGGDYSSRMEELFDDEDNSEAHEDDEDEEGFLYTGVDANESSGDYRSQLRDILGPEHEEEDEELEVERSLLHDLDNEKLSPNPVDVQVSPKGVFRLFLLWYCESDSFVVSVQRGDVASDDILSTSSNFPSFILTPERMVSPMGTPPKLPKPFIHPTISRLRSHIPEASNVPSSSSAGTFQSRHFDSWVSPSHSHFSEISRSSSPFNVATTSDAQPLANGHAHSEREAFRWTQLRNVGHHIYAKSSHKASAVLGSIALGSPTVLAANGLICIGTDSGRVFVFDFKQTLRCICGNDGSGETGFLAISFVVLMLL